MPYISVDIDVEEFYDDLNRHEKQELIGYLQEDGLLEAKHLVHFKSPDAVTGSPLDFEWVEMINKINESRYQLTKEQEEILTNLVKSL